MVKRDPHVVLGVEPGASPGQVKAAWRRLARTHHPDLTGDDPEASRIATRQMAEINDAYTALTRRPRPGERGGRGAAGRAGSDDAGASPPAGGARRGGPPRPRPSRPVTARVDLSHVFRPRNETLHGDGPPRAPTLRGNPPFRVTAVEREPPRASTPTGPLARSRIRDFRPPAAPALNEALGTELEFGKFHGHTLGEVAAFEPSYIDWLAGTITRNPDLLAAARAVRDELDRQGVRRRSREPASNRPRSA